MARAEFVLSHLPTRLRGLEIAPYFHPLVDRAKYAVTYVDCIGNDEIRQKAAANPGAVDQEVVEVDAVWTPGRPLRECLPGASFSYAVAAHVLEHVPDPLNWLRQILECLEPGGRVALLLPHRARCIDYYRHDTTFAQVVGWSIERPTRPTPTQVMQYLAESFDDGGTQDYDQPLPPFAAAKRHYTDLQAIEFARLVASTDQYLDIHCSAWTPESFAEVFGRLQASGLLDVEVIGPYVDFAGHSGEFLAYLQKAG